MLQWRTHLARLFVAAGLGCGIVGLLIGVVERTWKLGVTGWFTGGILLAILGIALLLDEYFDLSRSRQG